MFKNSDFQSCKLITSAQLGSSTMDESTTDDEMDPNPNLYEENELLHHVVLPRVLPQEKSENLHSTELEIVKQIVNISETLKELEKEWLPPKTIELLVTLARIHMECTPQTISTNINKLGPGENCAIFVRSQQCVITIHVPLNEKGNDVQNVIVATFPGSLSSSEIYSHDSGIEVIFFL